jgi:O-antigen/teichoic acid export membrane protein
MDLKHTARALAQGMLGGELTESGERKIRVFILFSAGFVLSKAFMFFSQLVVGRELGPATYGAFTIIIVLGNLFYLPITNGWGTAFVKFSNECKTQEEKREYLKAASVLGVAAGAVMFALLAAGYWFLPAALNITNEAYLLSLAAAATLSIWYFSKMIAQGSLEWGRYIAIEFVTAAVVFTGVLVLTLTGAGSMGWFVMLYCAAYVVPGVAVAGKVANAAGARFDMEKARRVFSYGTRAFLIGFLASVFVNMDRLIVNMFLSPEEVGYYQAYFFSTIGVVLTLNILFNNYLFPYFVRGDKAAYWGYIRRMFIAGAVPGVLLLALSGWICMKVYAYPSNPLILLCFAAGGTLYFMRYVTLWFINSFGTGGVSFSFVVEFATMVMHAGMSVLLIQRFGIPGVLASLLVSTIAGLTANVYYIKRTLSRGEVG